MKVQGLLLFMLHSFAEVRRINPRWKCRGHLFHLPVQETWRSFGEGFHRPWYLTWPDLTYSFVCFCGLSKYIKCKFRNCSKWEELIVRILFDCLYKGNYYHAVSRSGVPAVGFRCTDLLSQHEWRNEETSVGAHLATRLLPALRGLSYQQRCQKLRFHSSVYRRLRSNLITNFRIIHLVHHPQLRCMFYTIVISFTVGNFTYGWCYSFSLLRSSCDTFLELVTQASCSRKFCAMFQATHWKSL